MSADVYWELLEQSDRAKSAITTAFTLLEENEVVQAHFSSQVSEEEIHIRFEDGTLERDSGACVGRNISNKLL